CLRGGRTSAYSPRDRAFPSSADEGWPRHLEKSREGTLAEADGAVPVKKSITPPTPPRLRGIRTLREFLILRASTAPQLRRGKSRLRFALLLALSFFFLLALIRFWPHDPLSARVPLSTAVWSADGELLRVTLASDDQYRLWTPLSDMSPELIDAFL